MRTSFRIFQGRTTLLALLAVEGFLLFLFPPSLIFDSTLTSGGDTLSHYLTAVVLRERLFSGCSLFTWVHGNYAGFPLFLNYFPLPFFIMAILSLVMSLQIAFKLTTLLAIFPLPLAVYGCLRNLGYGNPTPLLGCAFSLLFLIMHGNSMWGGNIASTLAGEFAYGISFILAVHLMGKLYRDVPRKRSLIQNGFIEALVALSNGYPLLQIGFGSLYFLFNLSSLPYVFLLHAVAFGMISFWILPLLWHLPWDTAFVHSWNFQGLGEVFPFVLWPALVGIPAGWASHRLPNMDRHLSWGDRDETKAEAYLWWQIAVAIMGFGLSPLVGLVDIRFLPFVQLLLVLLGAIGWGKVLQRLQYKEAFAILMILGVLIWAGPQLAPIPSWVRWNYSGMETKPLWQPFRDVTRYLQGTSNDPRVVYEHSEANNGTGTVRAFEMLPHFSGRSTLEGLYMQSSVSSPFVFYLQSELSVAPSCPFPEYYYARFNPKRAVEHLRLFNVNQIVAVSESTISALDRSREFLPEIALSPFRIYRLVRSDDSYVVPVRFLPYRIPSRGWKKTQFEWFRKSSLEVPLVVTPEHPSGDYWLHLPLWTGPPESLPQRPLYDPTSEEIRATARLGNDSITIETSKVMHPLWIRISYHPRWQVAEGEGELYLVSPSFMLLVPHTPRVVIRFNTHGGIFAWGITITFLTCVIVLAFVWRARGKARERNGFGAELGEIGRVAKRRRLLLRPRSQPMWLDYLDEDVRQHPTMPAIHPLVWVLLALVSAWLVTHRTDRDPILMYNHAVKVYEAAEKKVAGTSPNETRSETLRPQEEGHFDEARLLLSRCIERFPLSPVVDYAVHYLTLSYLVERKWQSAEQILTSFLASHPDTRIHPEALYQLGICKRSTDNMEGSDKYFQQVLSLYPQSPWAVHAAARLMESTASDDLLKVARQHYNEGNHVLAEPLFNALSGHSSTEVQSVSSLFYAFCRFHGNHWEDAAKLLKEWVRSHPHDPEGGKAFLVLGKCHLFLGQYAQSRIALENALTLDPSLGKTPSFIAMMELVSGQSGASGNTSGH